MNERTSSPVLKTIKAVQVRATEFRSLLDTDAQKAIQHARDMKAISALAETVNLLKAGIFIDGGAITQKIDVVKEGVDLLRQLHTANPGDTNCQYNLANGLIALADLDTTPLPAWYLATRPLRQEARELWDAARTSNKRDLKTQALTNLGNSLGRSHRWSEAYDDYVAALDADPSNGVAAGQAARMLLSGACAGMINPDKMRKVASHYAAIAKAHRERVVELAGVAAADMFERLPGGEEDLVADITPPIKNAYLRFVARHHLALVPTVEGLDASLRRWDSLRICCFYEAVSLGPETPPLYAISTPSRLDTWRHASLPTNSRGRPPAIRVCMSTRSTMPGTGPRPPCCSWLNGPQWMC